MATKSLPPVHFFRPGRHVAMSGVALDFTEADLAAAAAAYDPALYQAPIVVGHPKTDDPAYGWVKAVRLQDGELFALPDQVEAQFADLVAEGRFKKVSASWFTPTHPANPAPGVYYLKHLGFLGAAAPAVTGLKPVEFAADTDCLTVEFSWDDEINAGLWRSLRDWLIGKFGLDEADKIIPDYRIKSLEEAARPAADSPSPVYSQGDAMSDADKARLAQLEAENKVLKAKEAEFASATAELERIQAETRHAEIAGFVGGLVKEGRVLPADQEALVAFMEGPDDTGVISFAETKAKPDEWLRGFLARLPVQVDFSERAGAGSDAHAGAATVNPLLADAEARAAATK